MFIIKPAPAWSVVENFSDGDVRSSIDTFYVYL